MDETAILIAAVATLAYAAFAARLERSMLTGPMLFLFLGWGLAEIGMVRFAQAETALNVLAEVTLVILLFSDASQIDLKAFRGHHRWPLRTLVLGMPLALALGTVAGLALLADWPFWEVALIAAILVPTDAALGQAVISNPNVPERVRRAISVESGLNDGLSLPVVLLFACLAVGCIHDFQQTNWLIFAIEQIAFALIAGVALGWAGGRLLAWTRRVGMTSEEFEGIGAIGLAGICYFAAELTGGNGFLAAFVGGACFGATQSRKDHRVVSFMDGEGTLLMYGTFLLTGLALVPDAIRAITVPAVALILVSIFVVRPLAVWLCLIGTDAPRGTRLFIGWFGPRGLATVLFALLVVGELSHLPHATEILHIATLTTLISTILHGASAAPAARRFGPRLKGETE